MGFSPAYLIHGFQPITSNNIAGQSSSIDWMEILNSGSNDQQILHNKALDLVKGFFAERLRARDALLLG